MNDVYRDENGEVLDLVLQGGRVIDPANGTDQQLDVGLRDGVVQMIARDLSSTSRRRTLNISGKILCPGFIDMHVHVYAGGTSMGIEPDAYAARSGVTTLVDTGSAGAANFKGFLEHVMERSNSRILAFLNVSFSGIFAFSSTVMVGEGEDMRLVVPHETVEVARANADRIIGVKVRVGRYSSGNSGIAPLEVAQQVAEELDLPLMAHIDYPPPSYDEVVSRLRPGDILTHAYRPFPNAPVDSAGQIRASAFAARDRGVLFDVGHGGRSFSFRTARIMIEAGLCPDIISSDVHKLCLEGPAYDLPTTMSKLLAVGMELHEVVAAVTSRPAKALRRPGLGELRPGETRDLTVFSLGPSKHPLVDCDGEVLEYSQSVVPDFSICNGNLYETHIDPKVS